MKQRGKNNWSPIPLCVSVLQRPRNRGRPHHPWLSGLGPCLPKPRHPSKLISMDKHVTLHWPQISVITLSLNNRSTSHLEYTTIHFLAGLHTSTLVPAHTGVCVCVCVCVCVRVRVCVFN